MPTVDVIVPCYNYARYLRECVYSVLSQSEVEARVLVIDDHSKDETPQVGRELAAADSRVEFYRHSSNRGHIATYNEGLSMVRADYVVLLSADDLLTPGALGRATRLLEAHPNVGFVYGYPIPLYAGVPPPPPRTRTSSWTVWQGGEWIAQMCRSGRNFIDSPEVVMRSQVQREIGGYRQSLPHSGDMEMWLRAAAISDVGHINGADQAYYRIHSESMQRTVNSGFVFDLKGRLDAFESAFSGPAGRLPDATALLTAARRALALLAVERVRQVYGAGRSALEPVADYCDFARDIYPEVMRDRAWHSMDFARRAGTSPALRALYWGKAGYRRIREHLAWRQWWRTGLY